MHELLKLDPGGCLMIDSISSTHFGRLKTDDSILSLNFTLYKGVIVPVEIFHLLLILPLLWICDRKELHEEVSRVGELRHRPVNLLEVLNRVLGIALVDDVTISHQNEPVEEEESLGAG